MKNYPFCYILKAQITICYIDNDEWFLNVKDRTPVTFACPRYSPTSKSRWNKKDILCVHTFDRFVHELKITGSTRKLCDIFGTCIIP